MIETTVLRLMIAVTVPIASALVVEQFPKTAVADVPFAFQVADRALPPGTYSVKQTDRGRVIRIQNEKVSDASAEFRAPKRKFGQAKGARLVFDSYSGHYCLSEIWFDADGRGLVLNRSLAAQGASSNPAGFKAAAAEIRYVRFQ
jgi:hypothetical protein